MTVWFHFSIDKVLPFLYSVNLSPHKDVYGDPEFLTHVSCRILEQRSLSGHETICQEQETVQKAFTAPYRAQLETRILELETDTSPHEGIVWIKEKVRC